METRLRRLLVLAGLAAPEVNFILHHPDGSWWMRFDMSYPGTRADHRVRRTATCRGQWANGYPTSNAVKRSTGWDGGSSWSLDTTTSALRKRVLRRVRDALIERGMLGVRRRFRTEWTRHIVGA
jgi:hypothetical protein